MQPVVYQTARGFMLQADRMIEVVAGDLGQRNPQALADMRQSLAQLKQAFVSVSAPRQPPISQSAMQSAVSAIAQAGKAL